MIYQRDRFGDEIIHNGSAYNTDYEYIRITKDGVEGSKKGEAWHKLIGRQLLGFDNAPKPSIMMHKPEEVEPIDYA